MRTLLWKKVARTKSFNLLAPAFDCPVPRTRCSLTLDIYTRISLCYHFFFTLFWSQLSLSCVSFSCSMTRRLSAYLSDYLFVSVTMWICLSSDSYSMYYPRRSDSSFSWSNIFCDFSSLRCKNNFVLMSLPSPFLSLSFLFHLSPCSYWLQYSISASLSLCLAVTTYLVSLSLDFSVSLSPFALCLFLYLSGLLVPTLHDHAVGPLPDDAQVLILLHCSWTEHSYFHILFIHLAFLLAIL